MTTLGVLDQSPVRRGGTAAQALAETLALARAAERLGYARYWTVVIGGDLRGPGRAHSPSGSANSAVHSAPVSLYWPVRTMAMG